MADSTTGTELRREMDGIKGQMWVESENTTKSIAEMKDMIAAVTEQYSRFREGEGMKKVLVMRDTEELQQMIWESNLKAQGVNRTGRVIIRIQPVHLEGKTLQWHQIYMKSRLTRDMPHWGEYVRALNDHFGALLYEDPMSELVNLKQTGTIQEYLDKFDELVNCVELSEADAVSCVFGRNKE
ncbi:hypothetical protein BUALT_Bualt06G0076200 [Buddleja alternifolia]|uniref:Retrotransposon gag domain-containing protein n=1 Tax=Buddleja alternifolia TaxID=168488 RepID=A0AAV6XEV7_9LAMI|nr:hypothetical protein BUALT_Bualt06G0076200 [Buddleja alternifolia]